MTRTISTAAELDALPVWSRVRGSRDEAWVKFGPFLGLASRWVNAAGSDADAQRLLDRYGPLVLEHDPSAEPAPEPDDREAPTRAAAVYELTHRDLVPVPLAPRIRCAFEAGAAWEARRHPEPVKPNRAAALHAAGRRWWDLNTGATDPWDSLTDDERANVIENEGIGPLVDAVLAVSPGRTEAEVLREAAQDAHHLGTVAGSGVKVGALAAAWLSGRADLAEREQIGGGDRG